MNEFFKSLTESDEFCMELGHVILESSRLESLLSQYLNGQVRNKKLTLGGLIKLAKEKKLLPKMIPALEMVTYQRNALTHDLHKFSSGDLKESVLKSTESEIGSYIERAFLLRENLRHLADIVEALKN